ncbi:MAG: peptidoglycan editing factor PgeF [Muribaculaceae bacterium]|nr:peptidoglycan editing factor PgeF [Muribaculaceae bacterium]
MMFELYRNDSILAGNSVRDCLNAEIPYDGFSVCDYTGDDASRVEECRRQLAEFCGVGMDEIVQCRQTHSADVYVLEQVGLPAEQRYGYDAIVTRLKNVVIGINTADCVPVVLFDEVAGVIAAIHAGWRGAVAGIAVNALKKMVEIGAKVENVKGYFGPSIGECCFEVGEEVASCFPEEFVTRQEGENPHVNLSGFVKRQLENEGVKAETLILNDNCTRCNQSRYFSARALGIDSGRIFTFIMRR